MKKFFMIVVAVFAGVSLYAQGINFSSKSYADLLKQAKKENKLIFIDTYTSWCGPCKEMSKKTFTDAVAGEFYNTNFLNLKVDAEKSDDGKRIVKTFEVTAYPTLMFVNHKGELVYRFLGFRTPNNFISEGEKALQAFKALPELEKYAKKYAKGTKDKDFLNNYYLLLDKTGVDCSDVLLDYFRIIDDKELLNETNVSRVEKVMVYDSTFASRLVHELIRVSTDVSVNPKIKSNLNKSVGKYLSASISYAASHDNEQQFEEVLALKAQFYTVNKNRNSVSSAMLGGGTIFLPDEFLKIDYYYSKNKRDKFLKIFEEYIVDCKKTIEQNEEMCNTMKNSLAEEIEKANKKGDEREVKNLSNMGTMFISLVEMDTYYIVNNLIEGIAKYCDIYPGDKDSIFYQKIADWYVYLHEFYPSVKIANYIVEQLEPLNKKKEALIVVKLAIEKGQKATEVTQDDRDKCNENLRALSL